LWGRAVNAREVVDALGLEPHPEGGWFAETYRASETHPAAALPDRYEGDRNHSTAIYYLLDETTFSAFHRVSTDEVFHFYDGDPVELVVLTDGEADASVRVLGTELARGERPQAVAPSESAQGLRVRPPGKWALLGATVAPGFDFADFALVPRDELLVSHPDASGWIDLLTRA
jgi:predicted cupin superfamily sugar epimerase